jgi:phosphoglycerol transferase MdoB-like AlkP superfamily enzyme
MPFLAFNFGTFIVGVISLVVSVQLGRGKWQPRAWMRTTLLAVNVLLVITVPVALFAMSSTFGAQVNNAYADGQNDSNRIIRGSNTTATRSQIFSLTTRAASL